MKIKIINALAELKVECKKHRECNIDCSLYVGEEYENPCFLNNGIDPTDYDIDDLASIKSKEELIES